MAPVLKLPFRPPNPSHMRRVRSFLNNIEQLGSSTASFQQAPLIWEILTKWTLTPSYEYDWPQTSYSALRWRVEVSIVWWDCRIGVQKLSCARELATKTTTSIQWQIYLSVTQAKKTNQGFSFNGLFLCFLTLHNFQTCSSFICTSQALETVLNPEHL